MNKNIYVPIVAREPQRKQSRKELDLKFEQSPQPTSLKEGQSTKSAGKFFQHWGRRKSQPQARQLNLWESQLHPKEFALQKRQKPQISSIPGTSPKQRDRYRVVVGDEILGERLDIDQALKLAKGVRANG